MSPWVVVAALGHGLVLEEHPLCLSWAAAKYLKKQNHRDDSEAHPCSSSAGQPVNVCLSLMEEPLILSLGLRTPHTDRESLSPGLVVQLQKLLWRMEVKTV